ncbi:MAG: 2Fe-2S iron-sulfur cluster-binding protein [Bacteroidales bacterium]
MNEMVHLTIDNKKIKVPAGTTLMEAASTLGIVIPAMCHNGDLPHFASCMVCVVKDEQSGRMIPSCSVRVANGMHIITLGEEVREARKTALDLLLSDHTGDCEAPCQRSCPAHMDIPLMNRHLAAGELRQAYEVVIRDIALPSILGRICPAPCEGACRRKSVDEPVAICLLKRVAGDHYLEEWQAADPVRPPDMTIRQVAVIGSGPHGLSAAWYLQQYGYQCTVFDKNELPGGALRYSVSRHILPEEILDQEIDRIRKAGVIFKMNADISREEIENLRPRFDALILPLEKAPKMAIRAAAIGKEEAIRTHQLLSGLPVAGEKRIFNSHFGRLDADEAQEYLKESVPGARLAPSGGMPAGFSREEAMAEAARCLHCDCRKLDNCKLRLYSDEYEAEQKRFIGLERKKIRKIVQHDTVIYEPEKCIKCGICVRITEKHREVLGLTFIGRGFDVQVGVPFSESLKQGLTHTALEAADACPTGALARKEEKQ